jgi:predicted DCC family thiol-disulfide oxidoreductase YuxK
MIVRTADGRTLTQARGVLYIMRRLGGLWRGIATVALVVPAGLMDAAYAGVARVRHRLFARPVEACPILPPRLRGRFDY